MRKVERLVNLIALLLNTRRPLTVEEIRNTVPGYQQEDYASFKRMFERDKEELRSLGIPIERRFTDVWEVEEGYLISKDRYYLPELDLTPDEVAALWIASAVVVEPGGKEDQALVKLSLGTDGGADPTSPPWLRARLHLDSPALPRLLEAVAGRRRVRFRYKAAGQSKDTERTVDPYALIHRQNAWYVAGHDHMRGALRHFKLPRISSTVSFASKSGGPDFDVPEGFSTEDRSVTEPWLGEEGVGVDVAFSPRIAWWVEQSLGLEAKGAWRDWSVMRVVVADEEGFVSWVLQFGEDAVVRSPDRMRKAVVKRLREVVRPPKAKSTPRTKAKATARKRP
ncbi:MAG TPA: WYL domain-containing protein [Actinomycetota bacterium]|nr:WYL domain-containing protein [Actinomycetota bacterium]